MQEPIPQTDIFDVLVRAFSEFYEFTTAQELARMHARFHLDFVKSIEAVKFRDADTPQSLVRRHTALTINQLTEERETTLVLSNPHDPEDIMEEIMSFARSVGRPFRMRDLKDGLFALHISAHLLISHTAKLVSQGFLIKEGTRYRLSDMSSKITDPET